MKKTKIIATIWPTTQSEDMLIELYNYWVNIIRLNFSHSEYENTKIIINRIKKLNSSWITNFSILLDTKWPEIRTWNLKEKLKLNIWDEIKIVVDESKCDQKSIFCDYPYLIKDVNIWDKIILDSWLCNLQVTYKSNDYIYAIVLNNHIIWNKRHVNLPWVKLRMPWITIQDKKDILFWIENDIDFIAMSFVRNKENIFELRDFLNQNNANHIKIISKIENSQAIENLEEIVTNSDWIMIARWDLWIETPIEKLPIYQKQIWELCLKEWKFFIIATHFLESMIENSFPTRAEVNDIYNWVLNNPDCLMLSWETAIWKYPIESVKIMTNIILEAEKNLSNKYLDYSNIWLSSRNIEKKILIKHWLIIWETLWIKALIILTKTWLLARLAAAFKSNINIFAFTKDQRSVRYMNILFWIKSFVLDSWTNNNYLSILEDSILFMKEKWILVSWDKIIAITDIQKLEKELPILEIIDI